MRIAATDLSLARAGDEAAFARLTARHRHELHAHCYRMLGSVDDADELLQETMLAAWRGLDGFAERSSLRTWLYAIATRRCLNAIRDGKRRPPPEPQPPFRAPEPSRRDQVTWLQPYRHDERLDLGALADPEALHQGRETIELAFVSALQRLTPRQTAVVVLRDVLGFSTLETAEMLNESAVAVKGLLQHGRAGLARRRGSVESAAVGSSIERAAASRFADAFARDDVAGVIDLLTDHARLAMPPAPHVYVGRAAIGRFLEASAAWRPGRFFRLVPVRANGQPAFDSSLDGRPTGTIVLSVQADGLAAITHFLDRGIAPAPGSGDARSVPTFSGVHT